MKTIFERCATFFALSLSLILTLFVSGASATSTVESQVPTTEMITMRKGDSLWVIATAQKLPRRDWPKYWKEACTLSKIACTDDAWKKLAVGTVITVPRSADVISRDKQLQSDAIVEAIRNDARAEATKQELAQSKVDMAEKEARLLANFQAIMAILAVLTLSVLSIVLMIVVKKSRASRRTKDAEPIDGDSTRKEPPILTPNTHGPWHPT